MCSQTNCRNCSDRDETLAKKVFKVRGNVSETKEKLGSTCVKRLFKLSNEKQIDGPTEKVPRKCQHLRKELCLLHGDSKKIYRNRKLLKCKCYDDQSKLVLNTTNLGLVQTSIFTCAELNCYLGHQLIQTSTLVSRT